MFAPALIFLTALFVGWLVLSPGRWPRLQEAAVSAVVAAMVVLVVAPAWAADTVADSHITIPIGDWFTYELIATCEEYLAGKPELYQGGVCFVGRDIGRRHDLHVIWVWEMIGDVLWCREIIEQKRATFAEMDEAFDDVMERYHVARACIDQTGMGEKVVEDAQRRYGDSRVTKTARLDQIARLLYQSEKGGVVEALLAANPGLAAMASEVPRGTVIVVPDRPATPKPKITRPWE